MAINETLKKISVPPSPLGTNRTRQKKARWREQLYKNGRDRAQLNRDRKTITAERYHETLYALSHGTL